MKINRQILVAALLTGALALVGCGGSSSGSGSGKLDKGSQAQEQVAAPEPEQEPEPEPESEQAPEPEPEPEQEVSERDESSVRPEFEQAMADYEEFFRSYVDLAKLVEEDPTNAELMLQMADMLAKEGDMMRSFEKWEDEDLTTAELALYMETYSHIMEMMSEVL